VGQMGTVQMVEKGIPMVAYDKGKLWERLTT